jgi:hypothetical protein
MSRSWLRILTAALTATMAAALAAPAGSAALSLEPVGEFSNPTYVTSDPGDPDRVFVVQRAGTIQLIEDGSSTQFLDIDAIVESGGERGLLSIGGNSCQSLGRGPDLGSLLRALLDVVEPPRHVDQRGQSARDEARRGRSWRRLGPGSPYERADCWAGRYVADTATSN